MTSVGHHDDRAGAPPPYTNPAPSGAYPPPVTGQPYPPAYPPHSYPVPTHTTVVIQQPDR